MLVAQSASFSPALLQAARLAVPALGHNIISVDFFGDSLIMDTR